MLELKNLNKTYQLKKTQVHAIKNINLTMHRGEFVAILGESGSGKTTLLTTIGGMEELSSGEFYIDGINATTFNHKQWTDYRKNTIGFIFQDFNLIDHLTAIDNIKIALSLSSIPEKEKEERANKLLEQVGMLHFGHQYPKELSGGQQQRIAIARALANEPEIILADEPTGALDPKTAMSIMLLLKELAENNHLVIMVTHDEEIANTYATRIVGIVDGEINSDVATTEVAVQEYPPVEMKKSSLQLGSALKVAINNLKVRKKSTLFAMFSLIPSMILVLILSNLVMNLSSYQKDIEPIYNNIVNDENLHYLSPMSEGQFERDLKGLIIKIEDGNYSDKIVQMMEETLYKPFDNDTIQEIESLPNIEKVIEPTYFHASINGESFIIVGLLPDQYKQYQYDFNFDYYPQNDETGLIISSDTAKKLGYREGDELSMSLVSYNSLPLHYEKQREKKNVYPTNVLKVIQPESKSKIMTNYYNNYIFITSDYADYLKSTFTIEDISIVSYELIVDLDPRAGNQKYAPIGSKNLMDVLEPLRSSVNTKDDIELFSLRLYSKEAPSNNFFMRHKIIATGPLDESTQLKLTDYGYYYTSQYDTFTVEAAENTNNNVNKLLLYAKIAIAIVVILPSILVGLILFISILLRTKEIGVLKAIGAKSKDIVVIFTIESTILAYSSGFIALLGIFPILTFIRVKIEKTYQISNYLGSNPLSTNIIAVFSALFGVMTIISMLGLLPGRKASKLHPRVLLRRIG